MNDGIYALQWMMLEEWASWVGYYLDDFITVGPACTEECMTIMERTCERAGLPIEITKTSGSYSKITFLGMKLDTVAGVMRLPHDKLEELQGLLDTWHGKRTVSKETSLL